MDATSASSASGVPTQAWSNAPAAANGQPTPYPVPGIAYSEFRYEVAVMAIFRGENRWVLVGCWSSVGRADT